MSQKPAHKPTVYTKSELKRIALKRAGWRRQDFANLGERWFRPDNPSSLGISLEAAWKRYKERK